MSGASSSDGLPSGVPFPPAVGGILIGKRLDPNHISIVAATAPGPKADNDQLGFALDLERANATLQEWYGRDPDVDLVGVWHTDPAVVPQSSPRDLQAAHALREQTGNAQADVVVALAGANGRQSIRFYHLAAADEAATAALVPVLYEVPDEIIPPSAEGAAAATAGSLPMGDAGNRQAGAKTTQDGPWWRRPLLAGAALLVALLVMGGLWRALAAGEQDAGIVGAARTNVPAAVTATEESSPVAAVVTEAPTSRPTATPEETAAPTATPTVPAPTPSPTATPEVEETPTISPAQNLPYALTFEPMGASARNAFLARARAADCADCYNVDIAGPTPFQELRIEVEGVDRPPLRNFAVPSLASLEPRPEPYTLQALDLEGNPAAPPITVTVDEGEYYVLTIGDEQS